MKKYQNFVDQLNRIREEEDKVKELYMNQFLIDLESELIKFGVEIEDNVNPESLNVREKDSNGIFSTLHDNIKIYWIHDRFCGLYFSVLEHSLLIQVYEISYDNSGRRTFKYIFKITPENNLLNNKKIDTFKFLHHNSFY